MYSACRQRGLSPLNPRRLMPVFSFLTAGDMQRNLKAPPHYPRKDFGSASGNRSVPLSPSQFQPRAFIHSHRFPHLPQSCPLGAEIATAERSTSLYATCLQGKRLRNAKTKNRNDVEPVTTKNRKSVETTTFWT